MINDFDDFKEALSFLFNNKAGSEVLEYLQYYFKATPTFENSNRDYFNFGRESVIKEIKNIINSNKDN